MRISEISIRRYGPLPDSGRVSLGSFSLLFGKNEYGKTLTIDALVKLLLRHGRALFEGIKRVDEEPEGYVVVEDLKGKPTKLPEKGDLTSITGLTPEQCRNILIVRNSDLSIATEADFYRNVTDRLTGLRTDEILSIKDKLQEIGKLTSAGSLRDWAGEKLKTRIGKAEQLIQTIKELKDEVAKEGLDKLEETILRVQEDASEIQRKIETFEEARKRGKYEEGSRAYQALILAQEKLKQLEVYSNEDGDLWAGCEKDIKDWTKEAERLQKEISTKTIEYEQKKTQLSEKELAFQSLRDRRKTIDDEIKPEVKDYEIRRGELKTKEVKQGFFTIAAIISAVLLAILGVGVIINPSPLLYFLLVLFLIATAGFAILRFSFIREKAWLAGMFERISLRASRFGFHVEAAAEILLGIQKFDEGYSEKQRELEQARTSVSVLDNEIRRIKETDIAGLEVKIAASRNKIDGITQKTGLRKLHEYREKLGLMSSCQQSVETQLAILRSHFDSIEEQLEDNLHYWLGKIEALEQFENEARDITYDEELVSQLKTELETLQNEERQLESKIKSFHDQLKDIEREANEVLQLRGDYLHCDGSVDMVAITDRLSKFIAEVEEDKDKTLIAISIFEDLQKEEEQKISSLFGKDSPISKYFREITGELYEEVTFISDDARKVQVRLTDGSILDAANLSGGAYDQLYLSIRLALGEKLLKGSVGFFIMDDPFIKADKDRLQRQIDILRRVTEIGWQIIYFTAKDEVVDALRSDIQSGKVKYVELQGMFA